MGATAVTHGLWAETVFSQHMDTGLACLSWRGVCVPAGNGVGNPLSTPETESAAPSARSRYKAPAAVTHRARPKSQILMSTAALVRMLAGLRSRWMTLAEWMHFSARRIWPGQGCAVNTAAATNNLLLTGTGHNGRPDTGASGPQKWKGNTRHGTPGCDRNNTSRVATVAR